MPYCWKCGAELVEGANFCPTCGAPVGPSVIEARRRKREEGRHISDLAIVLIVLMVSSAIIVVLAFLPVRTVDISESHDVQYQTGVDSVNLNFTAEVDVAFEDFNFTVALAFEELSGKLVTLDVSATGKGGIFISPSPLLKVFDVAFNHTIVGNVLTVTSEVDTVEGSWPWYSSLEVTCVIHIDPSMNASLDIRTSRGGMVIGTQAGVVLDSLSLEATTGGVKVDLVEGVVVAGDVSVQVTTGGVEFSWPNVVVAGDVLVDVKTATGGVDMDVTQEEELLGNVTLDAEVMTGGINFAIDIQGSIGAEIESSVVTGAINIARQIGFRGTKSLLQSDNYPDRSNFNVSLKTTTGGINVDANYTS